MDEGKLSRREFLTANLLGWAIVPALFGAARSLFGEEKKEVSLDDVMAKNLKYCPNSKDKKACPQKDASRAAENCRKCQFYTKASGAGAKELGNCQLIAAGYVRAEGWCTSYVKKA